MLEGFARHGFFDLNVRVDGDLQVDCHHTVEDTGIVLGSAIREAVGDKKGIRRYGSCILSMDEALVLCAVDLSGRPFYASDAEFTVPRIGDLDTEMIKEFFYAVSYSGQMNLHFKIFSGSNQHHICEAMFKAFAKALDQVRPGGVVAFVTSRYTMDSKNSDARRYMAQRAELLGAIRLPNDAFKKNAGTEVVSDILFLQKRDHPIDIVPEWVNLDRTEEGHTMNSYFVAHPEMVLGDTVEESTAYGMDITVRPVEGMEL